MKNYIFIWLFAILAPALFAQPTGFVTQELSYYSNSFYNYRNLPDFHDNMGISLGYQMPTEKIQSQFYYDGNLNFFKEYSDRFSQYHELGYSGSSENKGNYYFGANLAWQKNAATYDFYNYVKLQAYLNTKVFFKPNLIGRFGYLIRNRDYSELTEFSYWEHYFFARFNTYFQSGSSLTLQINYGLKNYIPQFTGYSGRRQYVEATEMPSVDQFVTELKFAQSAGVKTSVWLAGLLRAKPGLVSGSASVVNADDLFTEDELFDDRYGYTGQEISAGMTHFLPGYIKLELSAGYLWKNYQNRMVYNLAENLSSVEEHRADQRQVVWGSLSRGIGGWLGLKSSELFLEAGYLKNNSNDSYYQFDNKFGTLGLRIQVF
jgi:hypothetical protein